MAKIISSELQPCAKCLKKYGPGLENWEACKNCTWITKGSEEENLKSRKKEKICAECQKSLNFMELEKGKYLCGKNKCLRNYIEKKSQEK